VDEIGLGHLRVTTLLPESTALLLIRDRLSHPIYIIGAQLLGLDKANTASPPVPAAN
jgi:hypothetical protein